MPTLPTLTVTQAQLDRITAAFTDAPTYKAWLKGAIKDAVMRYESDQIQAKAAADLDAKRATIDADLGSMS